MSARLTTARPRPLGRFRRRASLALAMPVLLLSGGLSASILAVQATSATSASAATGVGAPSWWQGDCDATHWNAAAKAAGWTGAGAHRLGASYLGVPVCGPRHVTDHGPDILWKAAGWGEYEWECPELAFRFMSQIYGVHAYHANGNTVVSNYTASAGGGLVRVNNGTKGKAALPGDIISFNSSANSAGHVAVVSSSNVDSSGNGSIELITQNDTTDGWRALTVKAWVVQPFGSYVPYGWLHDPAGRGVAKATGDHRPFTDWDAFVAQQKLDFEGGAGTSTTRASAADTLNTGTPTTSTYIHTEMEGAWFAGHVGPVGRLYWAYFNRIPDYGGLNHWVVLHRGGRKIESISQSFAVSTEFTSKYGALDDAHFVDLVYTNVLGRSGDSGGEAYWTNQLAKKAKDRGQVMAGFSESTEYQRKMAPTIDVLMAYAGMLHRVPTATELTAGVAEPITTLVDAIRTSPAYQARVG